MDMKQLDDCTKLNGIHIEGPVYKFGGYLHKHTYQVWCTLQLVDMEHSHTQLLLKSIAG